MSFEQIEIVDTSKLMVAIPMHDFRVYSETVSGLIASGGLYSRFHASVGTSEVNLVRNLIASYFLESDCEYLVCIDSDIGFSRNDFILLLQKQLPDEEVPPLAVCAEYGKKDLSGEAVRLGMGFVRLHRSVFERLLDFKNPKEGEPAINHFFWHGKMCYEFFPSFADVTHKWFGEDWSFWKFCHVAGIPVRIEQRTRLRHWGSVPFDYEGPQGTTQIEVPL